MVTLALVICTLIYAFFDKPELLKAPYKAEKIILVLLLLGTATFSYKKDHDSDLQQDEINKTTSLSKKTIDSLHGESIALKTQIDSLTNQIIATQGRHDSLTLKYHISTIRELAKYGLNLDTVKKSVTNKDIQPTLAISEYLRIDTLKHERRLNYNLESMNSESYVTNYFYMVFNMTDLSDEEIHLEPRLMYGGTINSSSVISPTHGKGMTLFLDRIKPIWDNVYIVMYFEYKSKGNKRQIPLMKIYKIKGLYVREADKLEFDALNAYLTTKKILPKF